MQTNHQTIISMLPPWVGVLVGHVASDMTLQNVATVASIAYCLVGVYVMLRKKTHV
jgi:hypothetical protein